MTAPVRATLAQAAEWFRREGKSYADSAKEATSAYNEASVSPLLARRANILFAAARLIERVERSDPTTARLTADEFAEAMR